MATGRLRMSVVWKKSVNCKWVKRDKFDILPPALYTLFINVIDCSSKKQLLSY